jgi:hypothetical protein
MSNEPIFVKVARTGARAIEVSLNGERTVADALNAADLTLKDNEVIRVDGEEADMDTKLHDEARITLTKNVEGGLFN